MFRFLWAAAAPLTLAGCATASAPTDVTTLTSPADPGAAIRTLPHRPVLDGYTHRIAVEPRPWRQQNDSQAPAAETGS
ncbi:hypothetical protein [Hoeflea sp. BAL378]|uniref:hypothetical protein n=1 Tax=Hoeflea sp. BAL378 TaxID=1547437 RepID=UPI00126A6363|nr:hypothetical protein [Hoeflea sp. BAL378]